MRLARFSLVVPVLTVLAFAPKAHATGEAEASPTGKGITGGALLGAETVLLVEAALDVEPTWAYIVGGLAGAAAGGVGGYFVEQSDDPQPSMLLLAGGMALAIPTTVAVLNANAYEPTANVTEDTEPADEPVAEPPRGESSAKPMPKQDRLAQRRPQPPALVDLDSGTLRLSLPTLELHGSYTREEIALFGLEQETEFRMPVFNLHF